MIKFIFGIWVILIGLSSCYGTQFTAQSEKEFAANEPCDIAMGVKFPEGDTEYELIGTCESKQPAMPNFTGGPKENLAMEEIRKCACDKGGDFLIIVSHQEKFSASGGLPNKDLRSKRISSDKLIGDVYIKKG